MGKREFLMKWKVPVGDKNTIRYCENEWRRKGDKIISLCKEKNVVVQAGGNIGIFPYYLAEHFNQVITFEPIPKNYKCLVENTKNINNIEPFEYGLGNNTHSVAVERESQGNCGAIRLQPLCTGKLAVRALDSLFLVNLDLLWLDVEGYEVKALLGAKDHIEKFKPVIVLENNGLIHEFPGDLEGSKQLRTWMKETFNYKLHSRLMRDDVYVYNI